MQIFVKSCTGKTFLIDVEPAETIYQIKKKIGILQQIPVEQQRLNSSGIQLDDSTTISDSGIDITEPDPTLQLFLRLRGGGHATFRFVNMLNPQIRENSEGAPQWKYFGEGLNLYGICYTKNCEASLKQVIIQKGFGKFNMAKQTRKSPCPMCGKPCKFVATMSLYLARCKAVGMVQGEKEERVVKFQQQNQYQHLKFVDYDEDMVTWLYLELEIKRL